jgi:hypothetical protein
MPCERPRVALARSAASGGCHASGRQPRVFAAQRPPPGRPTSRASKSHWRRLGWPPGKRRGLPQQPSMRPREPSCPTFDCLPVYASTPAALIPPPGSFAEAIVAVPQGRRRRRRVDRRHSPQVPCQLVEAATTYMAHISDFHRPPSKGDRRVDSR